MAAIAYGVPDSALNTTGWLNVTKAPYSADPTGSTDATAIINDALAAAPPGGVVYIPGGSTALISGTLVIPNNVTLMGDPGSDFTAGSVITVANGANLDAVISDSTWSSNGEFNSTAPRVVGIIVDGNGAEQTAGKGIGIAFCAYRGEVIGCRVENTRGDGIRLTNSNNAGTVITGDCVENKVLDNTVETPGMAALSANTEGIAIRDTGSHVTDYWVSRNVVYATPSSNGSGIWADSAGGAVISDNHCYGTGTHGIYVTGSTETRIVDNYIEYFGQLASSGACYGIYATDDGGGPGTVVGGNVVNINQAVTGNTFTAIFLTNPASGDPAFYSLGPNMMYTSVAAATALEIDDQGNAANLTVAMMPQTATGFTSPYVLNNFATITGNAFAGHQQPAFSSTMSVDPTQGTTITIVLAGNLTLELPAYFPGGMQLTFIFQQPSTGGTYDYTVAFSSTGGYSGGGAWVNATFAPATGANAFSAVTFVSDGYDLTQVGQEGGGDSGSAGGDLSGSYPNPTVAGIDGRPVSAGQAWQALAGSHSAHAMRWQTGLANRHYALTSVTCVGDSFTSGNEAGLTFEQTWPAMLQIQLNSRYPTVGLSTHGRGVLVPVAPYATVSLDYVTVTGTPGQVQGYGFNRYTYDISASGGCTIVYDLVGTNAVISYANQPGGGSFTWAVDGGTATTQSTAGSLADGQAVFVTLDTLPGNSHTLTIRYVASSGPCWIDGITEFNGDLGSGVQVYNCGQSGSTTGVWAAQDWAVQQGATPELVIIELGGADWGDGVSPATVQANLTTICADVRAALTGAYSPDFLLMATPSPPSPEGSAYTWAEYVNVMYAVAAAASDVDVLDLTLRMPDAAADASGALYDPSTGELTAVGNALVADILCQYLGPA